MKWSQKLSISYNAAVARSSTAYYVKSVNVVKSPDLCLQTGGIVTSSVRLMSILIQRQVDVQFTINNTRLKTCNILNLDSRTLFSQLGATATDILSPDQTVLWLPPHLIRSQPCPFFLQTRQSSGSLHISFDLSPVHSFSRPDSPLAPSTSHSISALSILSPGHTVLWLPPHLIRSQPCPFFLQATRS